MGRYGLLVDFDDKGQPYISMYDALSIINWKTGDVGGRKDLTLVVLEEQHLKDGQDKYGHDTETRYRVLELEDGLYKVTLLDSSGNEIETFEPKMGANRLEFIPFVFCGSLDNTPEMSAIFVVLYVGQIAYTNHLAKELRQAESNCQAKILKLEQQHQQAIQKQQTTINKLSADYEERIANQKVKVETVTKYVDKIIERDVYRNVCIDDDGLQSINSLIKNRSAS